MVQTREDLPRAHPEAQAPVCLYPHRTSLEGYTATERTREVVTDFPSHTPPAFGTESNRHTPGLAEARGSDPKCPQAAAPLPVLPLLQDLHRVQAPRLLDGGDAALLLVQWDHGGRLGRLPRRLRLGRHHRGGSRWDGWGRR